MANGDDSNSLEKQPFASKLDQGRQRFLAHAIEHALAIGRRTPEDFIRHFPPRVIMEGLAQKPSLRATILVEATGLKKKIAMKKSWESAATDLQIAIDEGETSAGAVVRVFEPDDRVRYLDLKKLWNFLVEGDFWKDSQREAQAQARVHVAFLLSRALADKLLTHRDIVEGITLSEIAARMPKAELGKVIEGALLAGQRKAPFTEVELLEAMPLEVMVEYVPLPHIYDSVISPKIAETHGYIDRGSAAEANAAPAPPDKPAAEPEPGAETPEATAAEAQQDWVDADGQDWVQADGEVETVDDEEISDDDFAAV